MIKNNLFGQILIGLLVFFLLLSSAQMFGWGQSIDEVKLDPDNHKDLPSIASAMKMKQPKEKTDDKNLLDSIKSRPMFSDTRLPFVPPESTLGVDGTNGVEEIKEIDAQLTGVVITPQGSYAMILDGATNKRDTYKVGMPLSGEQGGWTLNSIQSRKVVFVSDDDKTAELELDVFTGALKTGGANKKTNKTANTIAHKQKDANRNPLSKKDKKKNADDIRKKIAERRAQMRAEAAKKGNNK